MEIICVNTGDKFDEWYVQNLIHMLRNEQVDSFHTIRSTELGGVYDKLQMFRDFTKGQYLYFDLDVVIQGSVTQYLRKELTVLNSWWRPTFHTPLNSSIISWYGDRSDVYHKFVESEDLNLLKYNKGIDEYLWKEINPSTYEKESSSYLWNGWTDTSVVLFNQSHKTMREDGPWSKFTLSE